MITMFSNISRVSVGPFSLFVVGRSSLLGSAVAPRRFAVAGAPHLVGVGGCLPL